MGITKQGLLSYMSCRWTTYAHNHKLNCTLKINNCGLISISSKGENIYLGNDVDFAIELYNEISDEFIINYDGFINYYIVHCFYDDKILYSYSLYEKDEQSAVEGMMDFITKNCNNLDINKISINWEISND